MLVRASGGIRTIMSGTRPYTFSNTIWNYSAFEIEPMWFFNRISLLALLSRKEVRLAA